MMGVLKTPWVDLIKHRGLPPGMKRSMGRSGRCWDGHRDKAESLPCGESIVNFVVHVAAFQEGGRYGKMTMRCSLNGEFHADGAAELTFLSTLARVSRNITHAFRLSVAIETGLAVIQWQHKPESLAAIRDVPVWS